MQLITIQVEITEREAWSLAQFVKRLRFDQCHELIDSGFLRQDRQDQAYDMFAAVHKIGTVLKGCWLRTTLKDTRDRMAARWPVASSLLLITANSIVNRNRWERRD